jgi:heme oxygenase
MLDRLREHTAPLHRRAERAVDLPSRCCDVQSYRSLLATLLGLYSPLEELLSRFDWTSAGIDLPARRKAHLLRADLAVLGLTANEVWTLSSCEETPAPATLAGAFGVLYVLEGATLGGAIIARQVREALGIEPASGGSFHACYGNQSGILWRGFCGAMEAYCGNDERRIAETLREAAATFSSFEHWLTADGSEPACYDSLPGKAP